MDAPTQGPGRLKAVVERILCDPALWPDLIVLDDEEAFLGALLTAADDWGIPLEAEDVRTGLRDRRREWFERWI